VRGSRYICMAVASFSLQAQVAEPILTKSAIPFGTGAGGVKFDYAGGIGPEGGSSQVIPEGTLEAGIRDGLETLARFPLLRVNLGALHDTVIGGGQLALGARYLLAGGADRPYGIAIQGMVEAPTGDSRLVGNATQVMPTLLWYWRPIGQVFVYSNLTFDHSIGGTGPSLAILEYQTAITWRATSNIVPAFEFVGSTYTIAGRTQLAGLPELIFRPGPNLELKAGLLLGLNARTPELGLRVQLGWFWGKRQ
jgi:hypothetical protein